MFKFTRFGNRICGLPRFASRSSWLPSSSSSLLQISPSTIQTTFTIAPFTISSIEYAKKQKRNFKNQKKIELIDIDDDDDDGNEDDVIDEKTALKAKGILHKGVGEAEEIVDDGHPKDYKLRSFKLASRRLDTLLNRTSGKSSAQVFFKI
uniref:Uncharacterized protein n=1 Tax=Panagrolaimus sp. ES5 TaxID=591445 RepID=A0AC34GP01_9BILA